MHTACCDAEAAQGKPGLDFSAAPGASERGRALDGQITVVEA